jgi:acyl-CoA synthetase (AMP-forming)/AMP-acid ligase II
MLGYLNADAPVDAGGWFNTQDAVEVDGDWLRILGRRTEAINVGGEKVFPAEVEAHLLEMDNVADATVFGLSSPVTGQVVAARLALVRPEPVGALEARVWQFCRPRLAAYKIPVVVEVADGPLHGERFKKARAAGGGR